MQLLLKTWPHMHVHHAWLANARSCSNLEMGFGPGRCALTAREMLVLLSHQRHVTEIIGDQHKVPIGINNLNN